MRWSIIGLLAIASFGATNAASANPVGYTCDTPIMAACPTSFREGILIYYPRDKAGDLLFIKGRN